ncbi:MAG: hypothetical protein M3331_01035 [Actinomycetota bacterium]|nr:hypothetical protein [Actinomycetota bacterium]
MSDAAIQGLDRTEAKLETYAAERGLTVQPELIWPGMPLPREQHGPIRHACWSVAGKLPGGVAGRLRHQAVYGTTFGMKVAMQHTIMVCRIPESVGYLPMLSVRAEGLEPALFYWANDRRPREDVGGFESMELDRRYIIEAAKGQDHAWLRQLLPLSFIDWLASSTPVDFGFRLDNGVFMCECPQYRGQHRADGEVDEEHLDLLAGIGGRAGSRIRDEVLEEAEVSWGGTNPDSGAAHQARAKRPLGGRLIRMITKFAEGTDTSVADFARKHRMEAKEAAAFHANHIRLPLPGAADDVLTGPLPGMDRQGEVAWLKFSSLVDMEKNYVAVVLDTGRRLESAWVDADDVTVPGFGEGLSDRALELARGGGFGVSTATTKACAYIKGPAPGRWPSGADIEAFVPRAVELAESL